LKKAVGGADLHFINFGIDEAPIVLAARVLVARAYSALALLGVRGCAADHEEGQEGNQEPCLLVCLHGKSLAHAAVMGYQ
jgi:hypothetical protein